MTRRILLPFTDDSTLFFVRRMMDVLAGSDCELQTAWLVNSSPLSYRQLVSVLPEGPDILLHADAFRQVTPLQEFDAIVTSRLFAPLRDMIRKAHIRHLADRPAVIAFQGGLEFDPERGFSNRRNADGVFIVPQDDIARYRDYMEDQDTGAQYLGFGHPTFLTPEAPPADIETRRDVYFFTQAISPLTERSRAHVLRMLVAIARANPDRNVWLKLRHLPHENAEHLHKEKHPYPGLMQDQALPPNLKMTADPMEEVLERVGIGITCTSTAAIDLVRAGVPTLVYLDYVENYSDPLEPPMRQLFEGSGLIAGIDDVLALRTRPPEPDWLARMFCPRDRLAAQVMEAIEAYRARPVQVKTLLPPLDPEAG